jgi:hypothetical protein
VLVQSTLDGADAPVLVAGKPSSETMAIKRVDDHHLTGLVKMNGRPSARRKARFPPTAERTPSKTTSPPAPPVNPLARSWRSGSRSNGSRPLRRASLSEKIAAVGGHLAIWRQLVDELWEDLRPCWRPPPPRNQPEHRVRCLEACRVRHPSRRSAAASTSRRREDCRSVAGCRQRGSYV